MTTESPASTCNCAIDADDLEEPVKLLIEAYASWNIPCECGQDSDGCWRCETQALLARLSGAPEERGAAQAP